MHEHEKAKTLSPREEGVQEDLAAGIRRKLTGKVGKMETVIAIALTLFLIYIQGFRAMDPLPLRAVTLSITAVLAFLLYPGWSKAKKKVHIVDIILILMSLSVLVYILIVQDDIIYRTGVVPTKWDIMFGLIMLITVLEMARRTTGPILTGFTIICILYAIWGENLPGLLAHVGYTYQRMVSFVFGLDGVYGVTLGVVPNYVLVFVLFGAFLQESGGTDMIIDLAKALTGRTRGGPAKMAIVASSLMGTISGSTVANVVTTGSVTIPLMKKTGYDAAFSGAVETAASSGGQIMPPIMGAAAFIMAELLGEPYMKIAVAAFIPAVLYYVSIYWFVDLEAQKKGLKGLEDKEVPQIKVVLKERGHLLLPLVVLIFVMVVLEMSPVMAALLATVTCIAVSWLKKETRIDMKRFLSALQQTSEGLVTVTAACSIAGVIIGVLGLTGLGVKLGIGLLAYTKGNLLLTLFFSMILAILLGMGQPSISAYIVAAAVAAPSIIKLGIAPITAHLFVFYFASFSNVTPPVAVASYVAAGLAKAKPMQVAGIGMKLCITAFIVPYIFVVAPGLLMVGPWAGILIALVSCLVGVLSLGAALQGWLFVRLSWWERALLFIAAGMGLEPGLMTDFASYVLFGVVIIMQLRAKRSYQLL